MLRALVVLLLLANLGVWVWQSGWLTSPEAASTRTEVAPERIRILTSRPAPPPRAADTAASALTSGAQASLPGSAPSGPAANPASTAAPAAAAPSTAFDTGRCLEAGPFAANEVPALKAALGKLPTGLVTLQTVAVKGTWLIYMGPFADNEALERKRAELRRMRDLNFEEARGPASLVPGLVLGRYNQEAAARNALESMRQRGIRTARVVVLKPPQELTVARAAQANAGQAPQLQALTLPAGRGFKACEG